MYLKSFSATSALAAAIPAWRIMPRIMAAIIDIEGDGRWCRIRPKLILCCGILLETIRMSTMHDIPTNPKSFRIFRPWSAASESCTLNSNTPPNLQRFQQLFTSSRPPPLSLLLLIPSIFLLSSKATSPPSLRAPRFTIIALLHLNLFIIYNLQP